MSNYLLGMRTSSPPFVEPKKRSRALTPKDERARARKSLKKMKLEDIE